MKKIKSQDFQNELMLIRKNINLASSNVEKNAIVEEFVCSLLDAEFSSLWFYDQKSLTLIRERADKNQRELSLDVKSGIIYKCFMTQKGGIYNYLASDKDYVATVDNPDNIKIKSKIIFPLLNDKKLVGIVTAYTSIKKAKKFTQKDMQLLESIQPFLLNALCAIHNLDICVRNETVQKTFQNVDVANEKSKSIGDESVQVMANFIHDIRTPANTLQGFLELLENQIEDKRLKEYLHNAKESANFINNLTSSMLEQIKMKTQKDQSNIQEIESIVFFTNIADMFISNMYAKNIGFNIFIDPLMPKSIKIDQLKLKRTLMNLLSNAYKFTPNGKNIEFSITYNTQTKHLNFVVKDEGIGIAKEKQEEIFKAFKQAEENTSILYGGTGLGLSICAEYVANLGGELKIKSEFEKGTQFSFELTPEIVVEKNSFTPVVNKNLKVTVLMQEKNNFSIMNIVRYMIRLGIKKENILAVSKIKDIPKDTTNLILFQNKMPTEAKELPKDKNLKVLLVEEKLFSISSEELPEEWNFISQYGNIINKLYQFISVQKMPKVLLVDDDKTSIMLLERILETEYCETESADNGKIALEMLLDSHKRKNPYSIVYIDNNMPLMSGKDVMKHLREFEKDNNLSRIYAVSTSGDLIDTQSESGKDFDLYIGKPFRVDEIRKALVHEKEKK